MRLFNVLLAAASGALLLWSVQDIQKPHCPQEDSCTVDYHDGSWHIEEVTP